MAATCWTVDEVPGATVGRWQGFRCGKKPVPERVPGQRSVGEKPATDIEAPHNGNKLFPRLLAA